MFTRSLTAGINLTVATWWLESARIVVLLTVRHVHLWLKVFLGYSGVVDVPPTLQ